MIFLGLQFNQLSAKDKFTTLLYVQDESFCAECISKLKNHFYKYPKNFETFVSTKSWVESYSTSTDNNQQTYQVILKKPYIKKSEGLYFDSNLNLFHFPLQKKLPSFSFDEIFPKKNIKELNQIMKLQSTEHLLSISWKKMFGWELTYNFGVVLVGKKDFPKKIAKLEKILEKKCCDELNGVILDLRYDKGYVIKELDVKHN